MAVVAEALRPHRTLWGDALIRLRRNRLAVAGASFIFLVALGATLIQFIVLTIGLPIGAISAYAGGRVDNLIMRFVDVMYAFPDLLLIILLRAVLVGSIYMIFLAIGLVSWVNVARLVRGQTLSLKQRDFVTAARVFGGFGSYITTRHLLPNSLGPVIVAVTFNIPP